MKFIYDKRENHDECVAFVHSLGVLIIKLDHPTEEKYCQVVGGPAAGKPMSEEWWWHWFKDANQKFYLGDEVTIEF